MSAHRPPAILADCMPLVNHMLHSTLSQPVTNARGESGRLVRKGPELAAADVPSYRSLGRLSSRPEQLGHRSLVDFLLGYWCRAIQGRLLDDGSAGAFEDGDGEGY